MKKLLLLILIPLLSGVFVTVEQFERLEERVEYLESQLVEDELLTETFYAESTYYTFEFVVIDGIATEMTICAKFDGECETNYPFEKQPELFLNSHRQAIISDIESYLEMLDRVYEAFAN